MTLAVGKRGIINRNPNEDGAAANRCFISAALVALSNSDGFRFALEPLNNRNNRGQFFVELKSILRKIDSMSSQSIDAKILFTLVSTHYSTKNSDGTFTD